MTDNRQKLKEVILGFKELPERDRTLDKMADILLEVLEEDERLYQTTKRQPV